MNGWILEQYGWIKEDEMVVVIIMPHHQLTLQDRIFIGKNLGSLSWFNRISKQSFLFFLLSGQPHLSFIIMSASSHMSINQSIYGQHLPRAVVRERENRPTYLSTYHCRILKGYSYPPSNHGHT